MKTVKVSGGDYTSWVNWEAGEQKDTVGTPELVELDAFVENIGGGEFIIDGWTTTAAGYIRAYTPSGQRHNGTSESGYCLKGSQGFGPVARLNEDFIRFEGLEFKHTSTANSGERPFFNNNSGGTRDIRLTESLVVGGNQAVNSTGGKFVMANCAVFGCANGIRTEFGASADDSYLYNNTVQATTNGITAVGGGPQRVKNCYVKATSGSEFGSSGGSTQTLTTCAHDSSTSFTGSTPSIGYNSTNFSNVTGGSENLHLASGADTVLKTGATDLSADATYPFNNDIDSETRTNWGIGADYVFVAPPVLIITNHSGMRW